MKKKQHLEWKKQTKYDKNRGIMEERKSGNNEGRNKASRKEEDK